MQLLIEGLAIAWLILAGLRQFRTRARTRVPLFPRWFLPVCRPFIAILLVGFLAFGASALVTVFTGIPQPRIQDEFSYLLAADTFAHGRITNPTHPLWKHFETIQVIQQPTYASKYPPSQGMVLALGQMVFGHPIVGVWLAAGMACGAICWMLAGWCPLRWALIGGLIAVVRVVFSGPAYLNWSQSYWGGSIAALGGALVFGALPRIMKKRRPGDALWLGLGLGTLANSRPFEGLVVSIPALAVLGVWAARNRANLGILFRRAVLPAALVLLLTFSWMGFYNFRVTGNPFLMPYQVHESTYGVAPVFLWQTMKTEPPYNHKSMREFHVDWGRNCYLKQLSFLEWMETARLKIASFWPFFIGFLFTPFLAALPRMRRRQSVKFAIGVWAVLILALLTETWALPHYSAPAASLAFLLVVESLRQARLTRWRGRPVGLSLVKAVLPVLLVSAVTLFAANRHLEAAGWHLDRARIQEDLEHRKGTHLVFVRYGPKHSPHEEWIYNRADIDAAKVVWAREMNPQADRELIEYFKERSVWILKADQIPRRLESYPSSLSDKQAALPNTG